MVTDYDVWHEKEEDVAIGSVLEILKRNVSLAIETIRRTAKKIDNNRNCECATALKNAIITDRKKIPAWLRKSLKPLIGKRILVTRAWEQSGETSGLLKNLGAEIVAIPTIDLCPANSFRGLDRAIDRLSGYDWAIFTSANAVHFFMDRFAKKGKDLGDLAGIKFCCNRP
jgi:uroporphyrinogen III methyltransferase/synthase